MFHIHKWSKWILIESTLNWTYNRQRRQCETCGMTQEHYVNY